MAEILLAETASGSSEVSATMVLVKATHGYATGGSSLALWAPNKMEGYGRLTGRLEIVRTPHPQNYKAPKCFRWGHPLGPGDLEFVVTDDAGNSLGAACITFTVYQIQRGCFPKQIGAKDRRPGSQRLGLYYATGTAGECGQPGLWLIRWCYRKTFGAPPQYGDCYFYVLDSVLCPVAGDTLPRVNKWGWGDGR